LKFTHLHVHSHYSLLDGLPKIDRLIDRALELGMDSLALTDHGSLYGAVEFYKKAKAKGLKPIIGTELYMAPGRKEDKQPRIDDKNFHLILLVKNKTGYQNLVFLMTEAWLKGFYYKPRIDKELLKVRAEGLIGSSACLAGEIPQAIIKGDLKKAEALALEYQSIFGPGNFFLELQHHANLPEQAKVNTELIKISKKQIFNPAAFGLVVVFFLFKAGVSWWSASSLFSNYLFGIASLEIIILGLLICYRIKRIKTAIVFIVVYNLLFS